LYDITQDPNNTHIIVVSKKNSKSSLTYQDVDGITHYVRILPEMSPEGEIILTKIDFIHKFPANYVATPTEMQKMIDQKKDAAVQAVGTNVSKPLKTIFSRHASRLNFTDEKFGTNLNGKFK
jgi:hypothetical protein